MGTMMIDELNRLTAHPEEPSRHTLSSLAELVETYPYTQSIVMLYLLNPSILGDLRYEAELQRWAPRLPSRERPYLLARLHMPLEDLTPVLTHDLSDSFALVNQYLRRVAEREGPLSNDLEYDSVEALPTKERTLDYFSAAEYESAPSGMTLLGLIPTDSAESEPAPAPAPQPIVTSSNESEPSDVLFTETLASIYIKQGHYERTKQIVRGLSLKFPEKISYFAVQLDFLEKLIDNASHS